MALAETLKTLGNVVAEAVKENPVVAGGIAAVVVVGTGGTIWYRRRNRKQIKPLGEIGVTPEVAAATAAAAATQASAQ